MVKGNRLSLNGIWQDQISCDIQVFQHHIPGVDNRVSGHILSIGPSLVIYPGINVVQDGYHLCPVQCPLRVDAPSSNPPHNPALSSRSPLQPPNRTLLLRRYNTDWGLSPLITSPAATARYIWPLPGHPLITWAYPASP